MKNLLSISSLVQYKLYYISNKLLLSYLKGTTNILKLLELMRIILSIHTCMFALLKVIINIYPTLKMDNKLIQKRYINQYLHQKHCARGRNN